MDQCRAAIARRAYRAVNHCLQRLRELGAVLDDERHNLSLGDECDVQAVNDAMGLLKRAVARVDESYDPIAVEFDSLGTGPCRIGGWVTAGSWHAIVVAFAREVLWKTQQIATERMDASNVLAVIFALDDLRQDELWFHRRLAEEFMSWQAAHPEEEKAGKTEEGEFSLTKFYAAYRDTLACYKTLAYLNVDFACSYCMSDTWSAEWALNRKFFDISSAHVIAVKSQEEIAVELTELLRTPVQVDGFSANSCHALVLKVARYVLDAFREAIAHSPSPSGITEDNAWAVAEIIPHLRFPRTIQIEEGIKREYDHLCRYYSAGANHQGN